MRSSHPRGWYAAGAWCHCRSEGIDGERHIERPRSGLLHVFKSIDFVQLKNPKKFMHPFQAVHVYVSIWSQSLCTAVISFVSSSRASSEAKTRNEERQRGRAAAESQMAGTDPTRAPFGGGPRGRQKPPGAVPDWTRPWTFPLVSLSSSHRIHLNSARRTLTTHTALACPTGSLYNNFSPPRAQLTTFLGDLQSIESCASPLDRR